MQISTILCEYYGLRPIIENTDTLYPMNIMIKRFFLISLLSYSQLVLADCITVSDQLETLIKTHAAEITGSESCKFRKVFRNDDVEFTAYTIEGPCYDNVGRAGSCGNNYFTSLSGIINGEVIKSIKIGGKGKFHTIAVNFKQSLIEVKGLAYKKGDAMCCPSINSTKTYMIDNSQLIPIAP